MSSKRMTRAEMIHWLGDAISTETAKPFEEIDYDFVDECGSLLDELMGKSTVMSDEEAAERLAKLKPTTKVVHKKAKLKNVWKVLIAAAVVLCLSMTVLAIPQFRVILMNVLKLPVSDSVEDDGITYIHSGKTKYYKDIESLITVEKLKILSFEDPDDVLKITSVKYLEDVSITTITFNDPTISFYISHNENRINDEIINTSEQISTSDYNIYIFKKEIPNMLYYAFIYYNNDTYVIECPSESTLKLVINSLKTRG